MATDVCDAYGTAYLRALEFCGSLVGMPRSPGSAKVIVYVLEREAVPEDLRALVVPPFVYAGDPVVNLVVQADGVHAVACLHHLPHRVIAEEFFAYPASADGLPDLGGPTGVAWRASVDTWIAAAVELLPVSSRTGL